MFLNRGKGFIEIDLWHTLCIHLAFNSLILNRLGRLKLRAFFFSGQIFFGENEKEERVKKKNEIRIFKRLEITSSLFVQTLSKKEHPGKKENM